LKYFALAAVCCINVAACSRVRLIPLIPSNSAALAAAAGTPACAAGTYSSNSFQVSLWRRVDAAFGRTGIPSFVLESVLGELQAACSRHLSKLAVGMSLELSATSERKTAKKLPAAGSTSRGAKRNAAGSKQGQSATSADSVDEAAGDLSDSDWDSGSSPAANLAAAAAVSGAAVLKEEIAKVIRVRAAGGEMRQRSVAQLSGGETKRVALALGLGFAELAAARARLSSNVLVLDEVRGLKGHSMRADIAFGVILPLCWCWLSSIVLVLDEVSGVLWQIRWSEYAAGL
jgi:hypothetical protein